MPRGYRILRLQHAGLCYRDEEALAAACRFWQEVGFAYIVKDLPRVKWFALPDGTELHLFVADGTLPDDAPCMSGPTMVHGCYYVDNIEAVWRYWNEIWEHGWTDPETGERHVLSKEPYRGFKLPGVKGRVHVWDPWNNHIEFHERE